MQNNALECLVINFQKEVHLVSKVLVWRVSVNKKKKFESFQHIFSAPVCLSVSLCLTF